MERREKVGRKEGEKRGKGRGRERGKYKNRQIRMNLAVLVFNHF
jgi:hypothetical protein